MGASVTIGGKTYDRALIRHSKGVKTECGCPAPEGVVPPVMLDLQPFIDATPRVRAGMILGACGDVREPLWKACRESGIADLMEAPQLTKTDELPGWLDNLDAAIKEHAKDLATTLKDMKGTLAGMERLEGDVPPWSGPTIAELREQVQTLERAIAAMEGEAKALRAQPDPVQPPGERPDGSAAVLEAQRQEQESRVKALRGRVQELTTARGILAAWEKRHARLEQELATAQAAFHVVGDGWEQVDVAKLTARQADLLASIKNLEPGLVKDSAHPLLGKETCPCCGATNKHWNLTAPSPEEIDQVVRTIEVWQKEHAANAVKLAKQAKVSTAADAVLRAQQALDQHADERPTVPNGQDNPEGLLGLSETTLEMIQDQQRQLAAWSAYDKAVVVATTRLQRIDEIERQHHDQDIKCAIAKNALTDAERRHHAREDMLARVRIRTEATAKLEATEKDEAAFKQARAKWQAGLEATMNESLRGVLDVCRVFTEGALDSPLSVHELEIGLYRGPVWIGYDGLSGSEKRIAAAAIQAALASKSEGLKLCMVDEMGVCDSARKVIFLANLAKAVEAGVIHQAIVLDNQMPATVPQGVTVMQLA